LYVDLLKIATNHLTGVDDEFGLDSLATPGGTKMNKKIIANQYELIAYLIIA
ncbi:MAG: hypothetical protein H7096_05910, partial [Flavobacterium sp.]|nr:hypothetical protein [Pedobacter sp.]